MKKSLRKLFCFALIVIATLSCSKELTLDDVIVDDEPTTDDIVLSDDGDIYVNKSSLTFSVLGETLDVDITANIDFTITMPDWLEMEEQSTKRDSTETLTYSFTAQFNSDKFRTGFIIVAGAENSDIKKVISLSQGGPESYENNFTGDIADDIKVEIVSASATSYQSGGGIELSYDGDYSTIYHSNWSNSASDYFPITLTYNFNSETIDYIIYTPRQSGSNGNFSEIEIYAKTDDNQAGYLVVSKDLYGKSSASKILFDQTITGVNSIDIKVISGAGDDNGFAACAEMEFYQYNPDNFDPLTLFSDITCSELLSTITISDINSCPSDFYKQMATFMYNDSYETEFRIDEYKAYQNPDLQAAEFKTNAKSLLDNPTGIVATAGEDMIIFVGDTHGQDLSLKVLNLDIADDDGYWNASSTYSISSGVNKITPTNDGLIYVLYHTPLPEGSDPVKIHFASGVINGYFDSQKHDESRWSELINSAPYKYFDVLGKYAHATFPTASFISYTPSGKTYIDQLDDMVYKEYQLLGLEKYNKVYNNRQYFHAMYTSYMYATSYRTAYNMNYSDVEKTLCSPTTLKTDPWGPAHEVGHCHQISTAFKWIGMTEVTTNLFSLYIQQQWGNSSRLESESRYTSAHSTIAASPGIAHADLDNVFDQLVPFWQLQLYFANAQGNTDFYPDIFEAMRLDDYPADDGTAQLNFVKYAVTSSKQDLTAFFEYWGFLTPIEKEIEDYSTRTLSVTQDQVDAVKLWISNQGYEAPKHEFWTITDSNYSSYK